MYYRSCAHALFENSFFPLGRLWKKMYIYMLYIRYCRVVCKLFWWVVQKESLGTTALEDFLLKRNWSDIFVFIWKKLWFMRFEICFKVRSEECISFRCELSSKAFALKSSLKNYLVHQTKENLLVLISVVWVPAWKYACVLKLEELLECEICCK